MQELDRVPRGPRQFLVRRLERAADVETHYYSYDAMLKTFIDFIRRTTGTHPSVSVHMEGLHSEVEFTVAVVADELDGGYVAWCQNLPGCMSQGETVDEALENLNEAISAVVVMRLEELAAAEGAEMMSIEAEPTGRRRRISPGEDSQVQPPATPRTASMPLQIGPIRSDRGKVPA